MLRNINHPGIAFTTLVFVASILFGFSVSALAQSVPCADPRRETTKFVDLGRKGLHHDCGRQARFRSLKKPEGEQPPVSLSGHVTHQNGVRMSGVTMTLYNSDDGTTRTVVTDEMGNYFFGAIPWGSGVELTPSRTGYEFYPPMVIWEGIVENEVWNFIAVGPPPPPPPPPANQPTLAWSSYFDNAPQLADYNALIGRDGAGNIYVGGTSNSDTSGDTDIVIFKTDANGNRVWARSFDGAGDYKDGLRDMFVDATGNIYLAGFSYGRDASNPALNSYDYVLLKYNTDGNLLWTRYYGGTPGYDDFARSLKVDAAGNAHIAGYSWGVGTFANYATVKYDTNGNQLWAKRFSGGNGEILNEVELDPAGNVYVTGYSNRSSAGGSEDIVTIKYNAAGEQQWLNRYNSTADDTDEGYSLEITATGDVLVLGETWDLSTSRTLVHKINGASGAGVWTKDLSALIDPDRGEVPETMRLDSAGNIILAGMLFDDFSYNVDSFVAKLDASANMDWVEIYDGPSDEDYDGDPKITIGSDGSIYLAVTSEGFANADIQIVKYMPDGATDWTYRFGNPFLGDDYVADYNADSAHRAVLLDPQGNVYTAGESYIPEQSTDLVVFKLEPVAQLRAVPYDFDGDRKADISVFRPETGTWWILNSSDSTYTATNWGINSDRIVPADYDGDGRIDKAVYRNGLWYVLKSGTGGYSVNQFGLANDKPVPADFDNDGKADLSVFRQGVWHLLRSSDGRYKASQFGVDSDTPLPADYDSNRLSDVAVFRGGTWYVRYQSELPFASFQFGLTTDKPVPSDYDGDKKADYAVFRNGVWYIWESRSGSPSIVQWGIAGDIPVPADYDGDKKTDIAVFRQGVWYILRSSDRGATILQFGLATDVPIPARE